VYVWEPDELLLSSRVYWEDYYKSRYPSAEYHKTWPVYPQYPNLSSSGRFNCHGYAWHMYWFGEYDELDEPVKMDYTEAENYFEDPSFVECTQAEADIWWINGGSHSAVATDNPAYLKSKWADGPLATHLISYQPWPPTMSLTTFYKVCLEEVTATYFSDDDLEFCSVKYKNSIVSSNVDLDIEFEKGFLIEGTFSTGAGATLYIHP
jgi:hypothetical protein